MVTGDPVVGTPEVAFLFTGHGSHHAGMGRDLYAGSPVFRAAIDRCDALLERSARPAASGDPVRRRWFARPACATPSRRCSPSSTRLTELWGSWGVRPSIVAGHSAGEYAAAVVAGTLTLEDGLRVVAARGRLMHSLPADGEMVAVFLDEATRRRRRRQSRLRGRHRRGQRPDDDGDLRDVGTRVEAVLAELELDTDDYRRLDVSVAAHSPLVEPILDEFERSVPGGGACHPRLGLVSSMTGSDRRSRADRCRVLAPPPPPAGALRRRVRHAARSGLLDVRRDRTAPDAARPRPAVLARRPRRPGRRRCERDADEWDELLTSAGHAARRRGRRRLVGRRTGPTGAAAREPADLSVAARVVLGGNRRPSATGRPRPGVAGGRRRRRVAGRAGAARPAHRHLRRTAGRCSTASPTPAIVTAFRSMGLFTAAGEQHRVDELDRRRPLPARLSPPGRALARTTSSTTDC